MQEIRTEHLTVGYDKTPLIGDVNLSVRPGGDTDTDRAEWFRKIHDLKDDYKAVKETGWNRIFGRSIHG